MKKLLAVAVTGALFGSGTVSASVSDAEFTELKAQFATMAQRLSALEAENNQLRESTKSTVSELAVTQSDLALVKMQNSESSWSDTIKWKGDFRYRYEDIQQDNKDDRDRDRIRARAQLEARVSKTARVGLGMATGGDDPVSTNQTLGGGGSTKDLRLDLAYFTWTGIEDSYLTAGKFKNPYYLEQKSGLIWDGDFRPEGAAIGWANDTYFANATYSWLESDSSKGSGDKSFWGAQVGGKFALFDGMKLTAAAGYLDFPTQGLQAVYDDDFFGNSSVIKNGVEVYEYDYTLYHGSLGLNFELYDTPLVVYGDYVHNDDADEFDSGYIAGIKLGSAKGKGGWQLLYQYEKLEANATLGVLTDSDFMGGGADGEGNKFSAKYMIDKQWYIGATYFDGDTGVDLGGDNSYQRLQVDTGFKY